MFQGTEYWKNYMLNWFGEELIALWNEYVSEDLIPSKDGEIHLEVYDSGDAGAPTIIFSHGIAGYARILLPFTIPLREKGYNLIVPDLQGYGYTPGTKGDFEWNTHVQNLVDCVEYAQHHFNGPIVLGGASMGGPLAYSAACRSQKADALSCWCLWDFSDREYMLNETNTGKFTYLLIPVFHFLNAVLGNVRFRTTALVSYDKLTDSQEMNEMVKQDPQAGTHITLKGATSLLLQSKPEIPHEQFRLPTLVLQPGADKMTPKHYIQKTFDKLGSEKKQYIELDDAAHFPTQNKYYQIWAEETDRFLQEIL